MYAPLAGRAPSARVVLLAAAGLCASAAAVAAADLPGGWQFRTFTSRDGLAHDIVRDVLETSDGQLWFATMAGITRYLPQGSRYVGLAVPGPSQQVMALAQGQDGAIWLATQGGGVSRWQRGSWVRYTVRHGLPSDEVTSLMVDRRGGIWATPTTGGVAYLDPAAAAAGDPRARWLVHGRAAGLTGGEFGRCVELGASRHVLCGTYDQPVLQRFDGRRWSRIPVDAAARRHFYVHALAEGPDGRLWLATKGAGAIEGHAEADGGYRWIVHDTARGLASDRVGAVCPTRDGTVWVATSAGVSFHDGERWRSLSRRDGLSAELVFAITPARDGALWFATLGGGASRYAPSRWTHLGRDQLASTNLTGGLLLSSDGTLWVGTDRGLSRLPPAGRWETLRAGSVTLDHVNHLLETPDSAVWVATRAGVRRLHRGAWQHFPGRTPTEEDDASACHPVVRHLAYERAAQRLWAATAGGVCSHDGQRWRSYGTREGLPSALVNAVLVDRRGVVWAATNNGIAERLPDGRWRTHLSPSPAARTNRFHSLVQTPDGSLWASGLDGVVRREGRTWHRVPPNRFLPAGIYSRFAMTTDDGSLWFAVRGLGVRRLRDGRWTSYASSDGLAADTVRDVLRMPDGKLLFATLGGGLSSYVADTRPPQTWVGTRSSEVDGGRTGNGATTSAFHGEPVVLHFGGQDVLKDTPTTALLFSHRLDGGAWSLFDRATSVVLPLLAPGDHTFEVRAMDRDLNVDPTPARHRFRIVRHWYRQPWLIGLLALSVSLLGFAVVRSARAVARERRAVAREQATLEQRRRFVRLASHELRKPLTRIAHRAEMLALPQALGAPDQLREYAEAMVDDSGRLARLVDSLLHQARVEEGLQLSVQDLPLEQTVRAAVERFVADSCDSTGADEPQLMLPEQPLVVPHDPFYLELALRNLLDNAHKYAPPLEAVTVIVAGDAEVASVVVRDRGPGIAPEQRIAIFEPFRRGRTRPEHAGFGLGLSFARDIARAHGGELELLAPPAHGPDDGPGCAFRLSLPLHRRGEASRAGPVDP